MFFASTAATSVLCLSLLFLFFPLEESRWLLKALLLLTFPVPVNLNLFAAPRLVLILGIFCNSFLKDPLS